MNISYDEIKSKFFTIIDDPKFFQLNENIAHEYMDTWIEIALGEPYVKGMFKEHSNNKSIQLLTCSLTNPMDEESDHEFVLKILSQYMKICWMDKNIDTGLNIAFVIGGSDEKKLQSNYKTNIARSDALKTSLRKQIRDYGYQNNDYIEDV